jgi:hypothetical protein
MQDEEEGRLFIEIDLIIWLEIDLTELQSVSFNFLKRIKELAGVGGLEPSIYN